LEHAWGLSAGTIRLFATGRIRLPQRLFLQVVDIISADPAPMEKAAGPVRAPPARGGLKLKTSKLDLEGRSALQERMRVRERAPEAISRSERIGAFGAGFAAVELPVGARVVVLRADAISGAIHAASQACLNDVRTPCAGVNGVSIHRTPGLERMHQSPLHDKGFQTW
jgi:hypothetical protein